MGKIDIVKKHFEEEASQFDGIIKNIIPFYDQMIDAITGSLPYEKDSRLEVLDLGCGTGTVSAAVVNAFPNASVACVDISQNMLEMARIKLSGNAGITYICSDFYDFDFDKKYDAVVSSLALHHLITDSDKLEFYKKINKGLNPGGILINADVVLATTGFHQNLYMQKWKEFMTCNMSEEEVTGKWIPLHYEEDNPVSMMKHIEMLTQAGFADIDIVWKYYNFAVYVARK